MLSSLFRGEDNAIWLHLRNTVLNRYLVNTFILLISVGVITTLIGFLTAFFTSRYQFPGRVFLSWGLALPLAFPGYITAFVYEGMLGYGGTLTRFLLNLFGLEETAVTLPNIMSMNGVIFIFSVSLYPYTYLICKANFLQNSRLYEEAAQTLKSSPFKVFSRIILPVSRPALIGGLSLVLMETLSDFGTVNLYGVDTFVTGVFRVWLGMDNLEAASRLASFPVIFVLFLILSERIQRGKSRFGNAPNSFHPLRRRNLPALKQIPVMLFCFLPFLLGFLFPFLQMIYWSVLSFSKVTEPEFLNSLRDSFLCAALAGIFVCFCAFLITYTARISRSRLIGNLSQFPKLGYSVPGAVIAMGLLSITGRLDQGLLPLVRFLTGKKELIFSGTLLILVIGYGIRFSAIALNAFESSFSKVPYSLHETARTLRAGYWSVFSSVEFPLIKTTFGITFIFTFVEVLKELPLTLILSPFNFNTLATSAYWLVEQDRLIEASLPASFIVLLSLVPTAFIIKTIRFEPK